VILIIDAIVSLRRRKRFEAADSEVLIFYSLREQNRGQELLGANTRRLFPR